MSTEAGDTIELKSLVKNDTISKLASLTPMDHAKSDEVYDWIKNDLKLPQYVNNFINNGYDSMDKIHKMTDFELTNIGINFSHRKQILSSLNPIEFTTSTSPSSLRPSSNGIGQDKRLSSLIKRAETIHKTSDFNLTEQNNGTIPIVLMNIELDRRRAKIKLFGKLLFFITFFSMYLIGTLLDDRSLTGYELTTSISQNIPFLDIEILSPNDFFAWVEDTYIKILMEENWYSDANDSYTNLSLNTIGYQTKAIGGFRIAQRRREPNVGKSCYASAFDNIFDNCFGTEWSKADMECGDRYNCDYLGVKDATKYRCDADNAFCGYYYDFTYDDRKFGIVQRLESLRRNRWIDEKTAAVHLFSVFYNNNYKRWITATFRVKIDLSGAYELSETIKVLKIEPFAVGTSNAWLHGFFTFAFLLMVLLLAIYHFRMFYSVTKAYGFRGFLHNLKRRWLGLILLVDNIIIIVYYFIFAFNKTRRELVAQGTNHRIMEEYVSLEPLADINEQFLWFNVWNFIILSLNGIQYFQVTDSGEGVYVAMTKAVPTVMAYIPIYCVAVVGFALAGQILFSSKSSDFKSFWNSVYVVVQMNFGAYGNGGDLWGENIAEKVYALLLFYAFIPFLVNIFLAIVVNAWDEFFELRNALASVQQFGMRKIALSQTIKAYWLKLGSPIKKIRAALDEKLVDDDVIGCNEFLDLMNDIDEIKEKQKDVILDYFWPDDKEEEELVTDNKDAIQNGSDRLKELFGTQERGRTNTKLDVNVDVMNRIRSETLQKQGGSLGKVTNKK